MPCDSGVTGLTRVRSPTLIAHAAIGRIGRPAFPAPSDWRVRKFLANLGRIARREREAVARKRDVDANTHSSCPGLTRASITLHKNLSKKMDCRVKPGNDVLTAFPRPAGSQ